MSNVFIDYGKLIDDAMHVIVRQALGYVGEAGLPGKHHFFISFLTSHPGVKISKALKEKYPEEMTIVLQHQFEDLNVNEKEFSVVLSFDNVKERIEIPFDSLIAFADPSVKFGLQFSHLEEKSSEEAAVAADIKITQKDMPAQEKQTTKGTKGKKAKGKAKNAAAPDATNVVDIDAFRKK